MLDILLNRRTIRKFKDKEIEKEKLDKIIKGALTSPSGKNTKPWNLILVEDKEKLSTLGALRGPASNPIANAPMAIVVIADSDATDTIIEDSSIISTVIQLMASSLDLASCWIQVRNRRAVDDTLVESHVRDILDIPENYNVECILAVGYPDEDKANHDLESLRFDKVRHNSFKD